MNYRFQKNIITVGYICFTVLTLLLPAAPALATQAHGAPEGLYVHQFSHIFFIFAMGILIYWLRSKALVREPGWRYLQYACVFFLIWSVDAFCVHFIEEHMEWIRVTKLDTWRIRIEAAGSAGWLTRLYYLIKLDHLLCVPGMIFLFLGLRRLSARAGTEPARSAQGDRS